MEFYNFFKSFLGIPNSIPPNDFNCLDDEIRNHEDVRRGEEDDSDRFSFNILMNPLEMHRYFEQQINEIMRSFGTQTETIFGDIFHEENSPATPQLLPPSEPEQLRSLYLKPGYEHTKGKEKTDSDIDGKVDVAEIDTLFKKSETRVDSPKRLFFGQSTSIKTIIQPDGSIETQRIVRDNEGNEECTITRRNGDTEQTIITKTDKYGKQEKEEIIKKDDSDTNKNITPSWKWFDFDKFYK